MTGLVILITGVWTQREPQRVVVDAQASVTAMVVGGSVGAEGRVPPGDLAAGVFDVDAGRPQGLVPVRNHATVEHVALLVAADALHAAEARRFDGTLELMADAAGDLSTARLVDRAGRPVKGVLIMTGSGMQNGSPLTAWAFREGLGGLAFGHGHLLVTLSVFLFGLSTAISWSYYGDRSVLYLVGARWVVPYRLVFCVAHFLGAIYSLELVWKFGDMALGLMTVPNLLSILLMTGLVGRWTREYADLGRLEPPSRSGGG